MLKALATWDENENNMEAKRRIQENQMKGPNHWMMATPIKAEGRYFTKHEFQESIRLRLGIEPKEMAPKRSCGSKKERDPRK